MELFGSNFNLFGRRKREVQAPVGSVPGVPSSTMEQKQEVTGGSYEERVVYVNQPLLALTVSPVYRALKLMMDTLGVMPVQYRKKDSNGGNFVQDTRGLGKRINYLLQVEPNPIMTASDMWKLVTYNQHMRGNGFVYIERDEFGFPYRLWMVRSGEYNFVTGRYVFVQYLSDNGYVEKVNVPREDVMHFANTFRFDNGYGFWGIPTLDFAANDLSLIKTQKGQTLETAAKGGRVKLIIGEGLNNGTVAPISSGAFDPKEMDEYASQLNNKIYQQDVVAIHNLNSVQNISMSAQEMQMVEQLQLSYDDVARYFGVPRPLLMLDTNSHYNDYQNATMEFHTRTILPEKADREKEIFRKLIGFKDYGFRDIHICEKPLLSMDPERQAKVDQLHLQTGWSVNEIRAEHDLPSVEGGDRVFRTANVKGLDEVDSATELKPGNYTVTQNVDDGDGES